MWGAHACGVRIQQPANSAQLRRAQHCRRRGHRRLTGQDLPLGEKREAGADWGAACGVGEAARHLMGASAPGAPEPPQKTQQRTAEATRLTRGGHTLACVAVNVVLHTH